MLLKYKLPTIIIVFTKENVCKLNLVPLYTNLYYNNFYCL